MYVLPLEHVLFGGAYKKIMRKEKGIDNRRSWVFDVLFFRIFFNEIKFKHVQVVPSKLGDWSLLAAWYPCLECSTCAFIESYKAAGVVLLLHCGYVSAPTDFRVSWRFCFKWQLLGRSQNLPGATGGRLQNCYGRVVCVYTIVCEQDEREAVGIKVNALSGRSTLRLGRHDSMSHEHICAFFAS